MLDIITRLFDSSGFPPRWHCGVWSSELGWLHIVSDLATWAAYMTIPIVLGYMVTRRRDIPFPRIFWLFAAFILACGTVHLVEAIIFWWPIYRFSGLMKAVTAITSWITVIALLPIMNRVLLLQSPQELEQINEQLKQQMTIQQRTEQKFRMFLESAPDSMLVINQSGRIIFANSQAESMFHASGDELLQFELEALLPQSFRESHRLHREKYFASPHRRPMGVGLELYGLRFDGTQIPVEISLSPLQLEGDVVVVAAVRDITYRKEFESRLQEQQEKLLQSERLAAVGEVVMGFAHESRNALQRAQANLSLLQHRVGEPALDLINGIQQAQDDLCQLFDQLRAYAAPPKLDRTVCHLGELIEESWADLEIARLGRTAVLELRYRLLEPCQVDRFAIRQVFRNIFENSLQATEGPVRIEVSVDPQAGGSSDFAKISICDDGPGLSDEQLCHLFDPFYTTKKRGMGLGLSISQRIVSAHGGSIEVGCGKLRGAILTIRLPVHCGVGEVAYA